MEGASEMTWNGPLPSTACADLWQLSVMKKYLNVQLAPPSQNLRQDSLGNTPCVAYALTQFAPSSLSRCPHCSSVPPDCTRSSMMMTCRPLGSPSLTVTMRWSPCDTQQQQQQQAQQLRR